MKPSNTALTIGLLSVPGALAWGSLGHVTTAYIASHFVSNTTQAYFQEILGNNANDYLASVASWADSVRYTQWGRFTKTFHFIDAHDNPPYECSVDYERDCKDTGCVINAMANYTTQAFDTTLPPLLLSQAAKFVIHFIGDLHQPLHNEDVALGGNRIYAQWEGRNYNLHHIWDTRILEKWIGGRGSPYAKAEKWANELTIAITDGKFAEEKDTWLKDLIFDDAISTAMAWSRECNALVCTHVFPEGPKAIAGQELAGEYFEKAAPVLEKQVARAGYRMAAWLDLIAAEAEKRRSQTLVDEL